jgi:urease accessory protein
MIRAINVLAAGAWDQGLQTDKVELPHDGRHRRRVTMRGAGDTVFLLDLVEATLLKDGDGLRLEDGRVIRVVAASEPLLEITGDAHLLSRVAWHLGNRHVPAEILPRAVRIAPDHVLEDMLQRLGAKVAHIAAPFYPEAGAYAPEHSHDHGHDGHNHDAGHARHVYKHGR